MRGRFGLTFALLLSSSAWSPAQVPAGGEFRVNACTTQAQASATIASDAMGNVVATWWSEDQDGSEPGIYAMRYEASGAPRGAEFRVNSHTTSTQWWPQVAVAPRGEYTIVWSSAGAQDGDGWGMFGQRFDRSGAARGVEFQVNTHTPGDQYRPALAANASGAFVVVWTSSGQDGEGLGIFAQRYEASGAPRGVEFQVNSHTTGDQFMPAAAFGGDGQLVITWASQGEDGDDWGVFGQRYDASGATLGAAFRVNEYTTSVQFGQSVAADVEGDFVVAWQSFGQDGSGHGVFARRYSRFGTPQGSEFQVNTYTTSFQGVASVASDADGNFVVAWHSTAQAGQAVFAQRFDEWGTSRGTEFQVNTRTTMQVNPRLGSDPVGNLWILWEDWQAWQQGQIDLIGQRFGGLVPAQLAVDPSGNGVLEPGETVEVKPSWRNVNGATQTFDARISRSGGPGGPGTYSLPDGEGGYGVVADGATAPCNDCYQVAVTSSGPRPAAHWDMYLSERLTPDALGQTKRWLVHIGESFGDVPRTSPFYGFVETLFHRGVTGGCAAAEYCPAASVTREQMAAFVLAAKEGPGYAPIACLAPAFDDVPASSPFCRWIAELARRGVVAGCGGGNYCPGSAVTREQVAVFVLKTFDPALVPPPCTPPGLFGDVPETSPFCAWIEELARRGVVAGCGGGNYCPGSPVTREQMAVFIARTFGLSLYGP